MRPKPYFRILAIGLGLTIVIGIIAFFVCVARPQTAVRVQVESTGGYVVYRHRGPRWLVEALGDNYPFKAAEIVSLGMKSTDDDLAPLRSLKELRQVLLEATSVTGPGLDYLRGLPQLEYVALTKSRITDDGLRYLSGFHGLKRLGLARTAITDDGLIHLEQIQGLEELNLDGTKVTDRGLEHLTSLPLNEIHVQATAISSAGLAKLKRLKPGLRIYDGQ